MDKTESPVMSIESNNSGILFYVPSGRDLNQVELCALVAELHTALQAYQDASTDGGISHADKWAWAEEKGRAALAKVQL